MELANTPAANRLHIGIYGRRNSGKSSLINAITGHDIALVSDVAGTTTDPVYKAMEIHPIGPCMLIDTAGFDDEGRLGEMRVEKTRKAMDKTDVALLLFSEGDFQKEAEWLLELKKRKVPVLPVISKADVREDLEGLAAQVKEATGLPPVLVSAKEKTGVKELLSALVRVIPEDFEAESITGRLVKEDDVVMLVMPQDIQAPKGRLILPQVQTIRDLLDHKCIVMSVTTDKLTGALRALAKPPKLIITDSQAFAAVYPLKPEETLLTSFSVLFAQYKGDIEAFTEGAAAIDRLTEQSKVLIAEACTHAPLSEDIGREKIPRMLKKKLGPGLTVDMVSGTDFPDDLSPYSLVIHCGACMFNRKYVLSRIQKAREQGVPITNYGVALAKLTGILDKITF